MNDLFAKKDKCLAVNQCFWPTWFYVSRWSCSTVRCQDRERAKMCFVMCLHDEPLHEASITVQLSSCLLPVTDTSCHVCSSLLLVDSAPQPNSVNIEVENWDGKQTCTETCRWRLVESFTFWVTGIKFLRAQGSSSSHDHFAYDPVAIGVEWPERKTEHLCTSQTFPRYSDSGLTLSLIPGMIRDVPLCYQIHPGFQSLGAGAKAAGVWCWPATSTYCHGCESVELHLLARTPSWHRKWWWAWCRIWRRSWKVFEDGVLKRTGRNEPSKEEAVGRVRWTELHNEELWSLYFPLNIRRMMKYRTSRWEGM